MKNRLAPYWPVQRGVFALLWTAFSLQGIGTMVAALYLRARRKFFGKLPTSAFNELIQTMLSQGQLARCGTWLHLPDHRIILSPSDQPGRAGACSGTEAVLQTWLGATVAPGWV